jgi:hypothetical protein
LTRLVAPDLDDVELLAEALVVNGLWDHADGGFIVRSWLKWNRSREEITHSRAKDAARKRGETPPKRNPPTPPNGGAKPSKGTPSGIRAESTRNGAGIVQPSLSPSPSLTTKKNLPLAALAEHAPEDKFPIFWSAYPKKADKRAAEKAWRAALKRGTPPDRIVLAAREYADQCRRTGTPFVKNGATWLNAGSYDNEPEPLRLVSGGNNGQPRHVPYQDPDESAYDEPMWPEEKP